jgi:hypothetical protein
MAPKFVGAALFAFWAYAITLDFGALGRLWKSKPKKI